MNEWREKAYRLAADLDNARKRFQKERTELRTFGVEPLIQELLPVADNLEQRRRLWSISVPLILIALAAVLTLALRQQLKR